MSIHPSEEVLEAAAEAVTAALDPIVRQTLQDSNLLVILEDPDSVGELIGILSGHLLELLEGMTPEYATDLVIVKCLTAELNPTLRNMLHDATGMGHATTAGAIQGTLENLTVLGAFKESLSAQLTQALWNVASPLSMTVREYLELVRL